MCIRLNCGTVHKLSTSNNVTRIFSRESLSKLSMSDIKYVLISVNKSILFATEFFSHIHKDIFARVSY